MTMMVRSTIVGGVIAALVAGTALVGAGCSTAPKTSAAKAELAADVEEAIELFKKEDPGMAELFAKSYGYAVFPTVGKGAIGVGGAYGRGEVFEQGRKIGYADLSQGTIGLQLGGQTYSEVIFFENKRSLDKFKSGEFAFSAQASAVAATKGASANADFRDGVMVFTVEKTGLMYEASIGGQKFTFEPLP
jgi:lipid-binding SYLF domain-containing protein